MTVLHGALTGMLAFLVFREVLRMFLSPTEYHDERARQAEVSKATTARNIAQHGETRVRIGHVLFHAVTLSVYAYLLITLNREWWQ